MSAAEFRQLAIEHGYDPRGIGGFFGGGNATMGRTGETVALTPHGRREIDYWAPTFQGPRRGRR